VIVRLYRDTDREAVVDLWRRVFPDDPPRNDPTGIVERKRSVQPELFLVGEDEERVIAALIGGYDGMRGWLYHLAVEPSARRQGHGRTLVAALEERLRALGCPKVNLQVRTSNPEVLAFYRKLGYRSDEVVSLGKVLQTRR